MKEDMMNRSLANIRQAKAAKTAKFKAEQERASARRPVKLTRTASSPINSSNSSFHGNTRLPTQESGRNSTGLRDEGEQQFFGVNQQPIGTSKPKRVVLHTAREENFSKETKKEKQVQKEDASYDFEDDDEQDKLANSESTHSLAVGELGLSSATLGYGIMDRGLAERLFEALQMDRRKVWVDWDDDSTLDYKLEKMYAVIEEHDCFVFLMTAESIINEKCILELKHALACSKRVIPVIFDAHISRDMVPRDVSPL